MMFFTLINFGTNHVILLFLDYLSLGRISVFFQKTVVTAYCGSLVKVRLILVISIEPLFYLLEFNFFVLEVQISTGLSEGLTVFGVVFVFVLVC